MFTVCAQGFDVSYLNPGEMTALMRRDLARWNSRKRNRSEARTVRHVILSIVITFVLWIFRR
jgi:hypothetical protein